MVSLLNSNNIVRRVIEIGGSLYIALPKGWTKVYNIKRGDTVYLTIDKIGNLIVSKAAKSIPRKITITADMTVKERLIAAYLKGYDIIQIRAKELTEKIRASIEDALRFLVGLEVVEESRNNIVLQCLGTDTIDLCSLVRRMVTLVRSMIDDAFSAIYDNNMELLNLVIQRDDKVDRLYFFIVRQVRRLIYNHEQLIASKLTPLDLMDLRLFAKTIEEIADCCERILLDYSRLRSKEPNLLEELVSYIRESKDSLLTVFDNAIKSFLNKDIDLALRVKKALASLREGLHEMKISDVPRALLLTKIDHIFALIEDIVDLITT